MKKLLLIGPEECFSFFKDVEEDLKKSFEVISVKLSQMLTLERQLLKYAPNEFCALVLCDDRFSNLVRKSMVAALSAQGFEMISYQSSKARIGSVKLGNNTIVMNGATLEDGVQLGSSCLVATGAYVGQNAKIEDAVSVHAFAKIGANVTMGSQVSIGGNVAINDGTIVGSDCEISIPGLYEGTIASKTYYHPKLGQAAKIYSFL